VSPRSVSLHLFEYFHFFKKDRSHWRDQKTTKHKVINNMMNCNIIQHNMKKQQNVTRSRVKCCPTLMYHLWATSSPLLSSLFQLFFLHRFPNFPFCICKRL
jgi:hypothetical protein